MHASNVCGMVHVAQTRINVTRALRDSHTRGHSHISFGIAYTDAEHAAHTRTQRRHGTEDHVLTFIRSQARVWFTFTCMARFVRTRYTFRVRRTRRSTRALHVRRVDVARAIRNVQAIRHSRRISFLHHYYRHDPVPPQYDIR